MITLHSVASDLCRKSEVQPVPAVVAPQTFEPHCLMAWEQMVAGADEMIDYQPKETQ